MKATMGTTLPTAIPTPTITILFPIFYLVTTTVPSAIGTPPITILFPIIPMATGTGEVDPVFLDTGLGDNT